MISMSKPANRSVFSPAVFRTAAGWVLGCVTAAIKVARNRRQMKALRDLDDYMLADIGLTRADLVLASRTMPFSDPTAALRAKDTARPRGRRGDVWVGRSERGGP